MRPNTISTAVLALLALALCHNAFGADVIDRLKRMIELREPVEGKFTVTDPESETVYEFGIQPRTWYCRRAQGPGGAPHLAGQSYSMTWVAGGNSVHAIPLTETKPLVYGQPPVGLTKPEASVLMTLPWIHTGTRFGCEIVATNITWDGLRFRGDGVPRHFGVVQGEVILLRGQPVEIALSHNGSGGTKLVRKVRFTEFDPEGFPIGWESSVNGSDFKRTIRLTNLKFGIRQFPESDGYTPTLLGEAGRDYAIFYSNRTAQVVGANGSIEVQPESPTELGSVATNWWIWVGAAGLVAVVAAATWHLKR